MGVVGGGVGGASIAVWFVMPFHTVLVIWETKEFLEAIDESWFLLSDSYPGSAEFSLGGSRWLVNSFHMFTPKRSRRLELPCWVTGSLLRRWDKSEAICKTLSMPPALLRLKGWRRDTPFNRVSSVCSASPVEYDNWSAFMVQRLGPFFVTSPSLLYVSKYQIRWVCAG